MQAKYRRVGVGNKDLQWLRGQLTKELDAWLNPQAKRVADGWTPEYLVIATNVRLSSAARTGGIDRIATLMTGYSERLGLKGWAVWDANQISMYLNAYPAVAARFAQFITPGDVLARAFTTLGRLSEPSLPAPPRVGQGQPGNERAFLAAYHAAGGHAVLGDAVSEIYDEGPGLVQHFAGAPGRPPAVLCARYEHPAAAVDARLWDAIGAAGAGSGGFDAVGFPVVAASTPFIGIDAGDVALAGGGWPKGRLIREPGGGWRWEPEISFSFQTSERGRWSSLTEKMDLRLRCVARIEWFDADELVIDGARHRRLPVLLSDGPLRKAVDALAAHFAVEASSALWRRTPEAEGYNDRRFASYRLLVPGPDGRTAFGLWARLQLPDGRQTTIVSMVDLRVNFPAPQANVDTAATAPVIDPDLRLSPKVLSEFFAAGWHTATRLLPLAATDDPHGRRIAGPTIMELHAESERVMAAGATRILALPDMLDLTEFGYPPPQPRPWMSTAVTTPLVLDDNRIAGLTVQTLAHMTSGFGYLGPE